VADPIYFIEKECSVCGEKFEVGCLRSRLSLIKQDTDFCAYYKDINPYYYTVWVCPHCGYAAKDTEFSKVMPVVAQKINEFLVGRDVRINLTGMRSREQAIVSYKLAIFYAEMSAASASKLAALHLRLGWLYREGGQLDEEQKALVNARDAYDLALSKERMPIDNLSELTVMYLIANLSHRIGEQEKAMLYLGNIIGSPLAKLEKRIVDLARELWQEIRAVDKAGMNSHIEEEK